jgi:bifunctional NMN adenylyltransferase/nudix hydrolase
MPDSYTDFKNTAVIIGRFQVPDLHEGHIHLIETVRSLHKKVIIFLGVSPIISDKDPLDYPTRARMISSKFPNVITCPLPDMGSDEVWTRNLDSLIRSMCPTGGIKLYGSRDSFIKYYTKAAGKFPTIELLPTIKLSGTEIREEVMREVKDSTDFRSGLIYQINNRFPILFPTVDIAVLTQASKIEECHILLGQKRDAKTNQWRIPGGFIDKSDGPIRVGKNAAVRELNEETGLKITAKDLHYVDQIIPDDWRYSGTQDGILTTLFKVILPSKVECIADDDLVSIKWFSLEEAIEIIDPVHTNLIKVIVEDFNS